MKNTERKKPRKMVIDLGHCMVCGRPRPHIHHCIYGTSNRAKSEKYGLVVPLCYEHHLGAYSPHNNRDFDLKLKCMAQEYFEANYGSRDDFRKEFGKSYL